MADPRLIELLAPAGNASVALSAYDAGADAVYCGLQKFNARERSENFTHEELAKVIAYAHKNRRKLYVTFNTLLKESELEDAAREIAFLSECRPDAVIVQDLGAARIMREYFPELPLHASTQLGIHNSAGLEMAKRFGFRRVILERQVTLAELRQMIPTGPPPIELELFIHGALCCCVSGSCLFSSWLGGWSGNRGKCKQPCRRRYFPTGKNGRGEFLFSPDDLCSLELLEEFRRLGICSLKIEGRLRRADYVEKVVRAYRTVLDADMDKRKEALEEAGRILRGAVTRKTSVGFYSTESMRRLIRLDPCGGSGIPCGKVEKCVPGGFEAKMSGRIHVGDTIRIQADSDAADGFNMTVLYLEKGRNSVLKIQGGERCFIRADHRPAPGSLIYRTGEAGSDLSGRIARLPQARIPLDLTIRLEKKSLTVDLPGTELKFVGEFPALAPARDHAVSPDDLMKMFSAGSEIFTAGHLKAEADGRWFLPAGQLKELRRSFWSWAEQNVPKDLPRQRSLLAVRRFLADMAHLSELDRPEKLPDCTAADIGKIEGIKAGNIDSAAPGDEVILPPFVPEGELEALKRKIELLRGQGIRVFRITSFFQFVLFPEEIRDQVTMKTMFPFPVCNSQNILVCQECGASAVQAWIELGQGDYADLFRHSVLPLEAYVQGRPCIFMTRASVPFEGQHIRDIRGNGFELERLGALTGLYPEEPFCIEVPEGYSAFRDLRKNGGKTDTVSNFNYYRGWS